MPRLTIDERVIEVPDGEKVIQAAERLGIMIPRFCYHPALGSVGACRVCAVKFLEGPVMGIQMSCMVDAMDDMVVSTTDDEVVDFRRHVIEWLMMNHPHDCPVCDEGGHCLLQDMTVSGGHGLRRYPGRKRTYTDQDLGPLVQHEMNRCIHCYRCSRFYQAFCGYRDLGVMQIGSRTFFGRFRDGTLQNPFSGNLSDICPTGVYTDKPSRYKGRRWDYERSPSVCIHCSLGCHITVSVRYREIVRHEARLCPDINGHFICDRGRFGFYYTEDDRRPRHARVDGEKRAVTDVLNMVKERLDTITGQSGPGAVACAGGRRSSLETCHALSELCRTNGWHGPAFFSHRRQAESVKTAVSRLDPELAVSMGEIESADFVLVVGADPVNEAPMLALALRQAHRKGGEVVVIDPRPVSLPFAFDHLAVPPLEIERWLGAIIKATVDASEAASLGQTALDRLRGLPSIGDGDRHSAGRLAGIAERLRNAGRPVIVCGTEVPGESATALAGDAVRLLRTDGKAAGLFYLLPGANAFGAALFAASAFDQILERIEAGEIRALVVVEWDPLRRYPDLARVERAIEKLDSLIVLDHVASRTIAAAGVVVPTATVYESGGMFVNQEGRLQAAPSAYSGGIPIKSAGAGSHPPRVYGRDPSGPEQWPAWRVAAYWTGDARAGERRPPSSWPPGPLFEQLGLPADTRLPEAGVRIEAGFDRRCSFQCLAQTVSEGEAAVPALLTVEQTFGTEALSEMSAPLQQLTDSPHLGMHPEDAAAYGVEAGDQVTVETESGEVTAAVRLSSRMAKGILTLPRRSILDWQIVDPGQHPARVRRIAKVDR